MRNPRPQTMTQSVQGTKTSSPGTSSEAVMDPTLQQTLKGNWSHQSLPNVKGQWEDVHDLLSCSPMSGLEEKGAPLGELGGLSR